MNANIEKTTIRKVYLRLLPLLFVSYFVCYLDRINVDFATLTMNKDLGFTATVFALGATAFFWGYCLFEIPSNIVVRPRQRAQVFGVPLTAARWNLSQVEVEFLRDRS